MDEMRYEEVSLTQKHQGKRPEDVATKVDMIGFSDGGGGSASDDYDKKNKEIFENAMSSAGLPASMTLSSISYDGSTQPSSSNVFKIGSMLMTKCSSSRPFKAVYYAGSAEENIVFGDVILSHPNEVSFCMGGYRYTITIDGSTAIADKVFIGESIPETEIWDKYFQNLIGTTDFQLGDVILEGLNVLPGTPLYNYLYTIYKEVQMKGSMYVTWKYYPTTTGDKEIVVVPAAIDRNNDLVFGLAVGNMTYAIETNDAVNPDYFQVRGSNDLRDSEEFTRIFIKHNNGNEFYFKDINYTVEGTEYDMTTTAFKAASTVQYYLIYSNGEAYMIPWSKSPFGGETEYSVVPVTKDPTDPTELTYKFNVGGNTYKLVFDAQTPTKVTAYLATSEEDKRDSIEFDKIFKEMIIDDNFTLSDIEYTKEGRVYTPSDLAHSCVFKLMYYLNENDKYSVHGTWRRNTYYPPNPAWDQITVVDICLTDDLNTMAFYLGGTKYKLYCDSTKMIAYKIDDVDTRDSIEFDKIYKETIGSESLVLGDLNYSIGGYLYDYTTDEFKAAYAMWVKLANSTRVAFNATWSRFDVAPDTVEITSVPLVIEPSNPYRMSFMAGGNEYLLSLEPFTGEPTQLRAQIVEAFEDTRDSFVFMDMYKYLTDTELPLGKVTYSIAGEEYDSTTDIYKVATALYDELSAGNISIPAPWGLYDETSDTPEISIVTVVKDDAPNTLKYSVAGVTYKLELTNNNTVKAYIIQSDDLRDSFEYDRIFQELIGTTPGDPVRMLRTFDYANGVTYVSGTAKFDYLNKIRLKLIDLLTTSNYWFIKLPLDETIVNSEVELSIGEASLETQYKFVFYDHNGRYETEFESNMSSVTTKYYALDKRDSFEWTDIFEKHIGAAQDNNEITLDMFEWTVEGVEYIQTNPFYNYISSLFGGTITGIMAPYHRDTVSGNKEYEMVHINTIDPYYIEFFRNNTRYWAHKALSGVVTCYIDDVKDLRDSEEFDRLFQTVVLRDESTRLLLNSIVIDGMEYDAGDTRFDDLLNIYREIQAKGGLYTTWNLYSVADHIEILNSFAYPEGPGMFALDVLGTHYQVIFDDPDNPTKVTIYIPTTDDLRDSSVYNENYQTYIGALADEFALSYIDYSESGEVLDPNGPYYNYVKKTIQYVMDSDGGLSMLTWSLINSDGELHVVAANYDNGSVTFTIGDYVYSLTVVSSDIIASKRQISKGEITRYVEAFETVVGKTLDDPFYLINVDYSLEGSHYDADSEKAQYLKRIIENNTGAFAMIVPWDAENVGDLDGDFIKEYVITSAHINHNESMRFCVGGVDRRVVLHPDGSIDAYVLPVPDERDSVIFTDIFDTLVAGAGVHDYRLVKTNFTLDGEVYDSNSDEFKVAYKVGSTLADGDMLFVPYDVTDTLVQAYYHDEIITLPVVKYSTPEGFTLSFCHGGTTKELVVDVANKTVTAKIVPQSEAAGDFVFLNKKFQEIVESVDSNEFYLHDLAYEEGQGYELQTNQFPGSCILNIWNKMFRNLDNDVLWATWDETHYDSEYKEWIPMCVQIYRHGVGVSILRFEALGDLYEFEFSEDSSLVWCRKVVNNDKHDHERYTIAFEGLAGRSLNDPFYLEMPDWTVEGTVYNDSWEYHKSMMQIFKSGITNMLAPWNTTFVNGETEYVLTNITIKDANVMTFSINGSNYKAVLTENPTEVPKFTCYLVDSGSKHDSERYLEIFETTVGRTVSDPLYLSAIDYGSKNNPEYYDDSWEYYTNINNLLMSLADTNSSIVAPWSKEEYPNDTEYIFTSVGLNWHDESMSFMVNGMLYKIGLYIDTSTGEEIILFKCWYEELNDTRDHEEYNEIFQTLIGRTVENPFLMKQLNYTPEGTRFLKSSEEGQIVDTLWRQFWYGYHNVIYITYDVTSFGSSGVEWVCTPIYSDDTYGLSFTVNGTTYGIWGDDDDPDYYVATAYRGGGEDTRDSIVWNKEFQNRVGTTNFVFNDLPWMNEPGYVMDSSNPMYLPLSRAFTTDYNIYYPGTWCSSADLYGERYVMVDVLGNPGQISFTLNGATYTATKEQNDTIRILVSSATGEDTRDSEVYYNRYVSLLSEKGATVFPNMTDYTWSVVGTQIGGPGSTDPMVKALLALTQVINSVNQLVIPVSSHVDGSTSKTEHYMVLADIDDSDTSTPYKGIRFSYGGITYYTRYNSAIGYFTLYKTQPPTGDDIPTMWKNSFYKAMQMDPETATFGLGDIAAGTYTSGHQYYTNIFRLFQALTSVITPYDTKTAEVVLGWRTLATYKYPVFVELVMGSTINAEFYYVLGTTKTSLQLDVTAGSLTVTKTAV